MGLYQGGGGYELSGGSPINFTGNTSVEVGIKAIAEDILIQEAIFVNGCFLTMVAMDENRKPVHVPHFPHPIRMNCDATRQQNSGDTC